jgi:hypothetical protein
MLEFFKIHNKPIAVYVSSQLIQLEAELQAGVINPSLSNKMSTKFIISNINHSLYILKFKNAYKLALNKFQKHITQHPALSLFKAIRCFDPKYIHSQEERKNISLYQDILEFKNPKDVIIQEWGIYVNLNETFDDNIDLDLDKYWKEKSKYLPNLSKIALIYIWIPVSGVDVERSFSIYKNILSDRRVNLSENSINILNFMYFNN